MRVIRLVSAMSDDMVSHVIKKQLLRSGTSVAANFREASRARSDAEFISKLGIVEQELDETLLWFELIVESKLIPHDRISELMKEADELLSIVVSAVIATKKRMK
ncbi:four helix bundle protein [Rubinisphaera sp.]|uniref:four helix bundle protein n=1 Tax=Rubinisphaera sp. TaxID=2024857 RepID=UPI0025CBEA21|nr:four helix bundle protein [Rubinisphaera sp.]